MAEAATNGAEEREAGEVEPVQPAVLEEADITGILPEEVWNMIFQYLSPQDKLNSCRTSAKSTFYLYLDPDKMLWMFDAILPLLMPYLDTHAVLRCRGVSKHWRSVVESYLQNHLYHRGLSPSENLPYYHILQERDVLQGWRRGRLRQMKLNDEPYMEKFMAQLSGLEHYGNPFVSRAVSLHYHGDTTLQFLDALGEHLWHLSIHLDAPPEPFMKTLHRTLKRVPNLRKLHLEGDYQFKRDLRGLLGDDGNIIPQELARLTDAMEIYLEGNRCPVLPFLEHVSIKFEKATGSFNEIMRNLLLESLHCEQIKRLVLDHPPKVIGQGEVYLQFPWFPQGWANLTELDLVLHSNDQLKDLVHSNAPLKRLVLNLHYFILDINFQLVAKAVGDFGTTLEYLEIATEFDFVRGHCLSRRPSETPASEGVLPALAGVQNLKMFKLTNLLQWGRHFIPGLKTLEYLYVEFCREFEMYVGDPERQVEMYLGASPNSPVRMRSSPLWNELPKLKCFRRQRKDSERDEEYCSRGMWEEFQRNGGGGGDEVEFEGLGHE